MSGGAELNHGAREWAPPAESPRGWTAAPSWTPPPSFHSPSDDTPPYHATAGSRSRASGGDGTPPPPPYAAVVAPVAMSGMLQHDDEAEWAGDGGEDHVADDAFDDGFDVDTVGRGAETADGGPFAPDLSFDPLADDVIVVRDAPIPTPHRAPSALTLQSSAQVRLAFATEIQRCAPWVPADAIRVVCDTESGTVFAQGSRAGVAELFARTNGMVSLVHGPSASHADWPTPEEREACAARLHTLQRMSEWHAEVAAATTTCGGTAAMRAHTSTHVPHDLVGTCFRDCGPFIVPGPSSTKPPYVCPRCECCVWCGTATVPHVGSCIECGGAGCRPREEPFGGVVVQAADASFATAAATTASVARWMRRVALSAHMAVGVTEHHHTPGQPALAVAWPTSTHANCPVFHRDAVTTRLLQASGFFPTLTRVLSEHFDLAPEEAASPTEFLLTATLWLLLRLPGNGSVLKEGFTIFGGAIRDFVLRRVWPIDDIDVACPLCFLVRKEEDSVSSAPSPGSTAPPTLVDVLRRALESSPQTIRRFVSVAAAETKPGVPERVSVQYEFASVVVELVDASHFANGNVDMTFNNIELTRHGLRQKYPGAGGGSLLTTLRDVFQRRGLAVNFFQNNGYQKRRRERRVQAADPLRRYGLENLHRSPVDSFAAFPPTRAMRQSEQHQFLSLLFASGLSHGTGL